MKISHSDLRRFTRCRRQWHFNSRHALNLEPKEPQDNLVLGRGFHEALAEYYDQRSNYDDHSDLKSYIEDCVEAWCAYQKQDIINDTELIFDDHMDDINDVIRLLKGMTSNYMDWAHEHDDETFEEVVDTEVHFELPIHHPRSGEQIGIFEGYLDAVVRDQYGDLWLKEFKTASRISTDHLILDEQTTRYLPAIEHLYGEKPVGVLYTIARKKLPTEISVNKSGKVSRRKVVTTYERYRDKLVEVHGSEDEVPWDHYEDVLEYYRNQDNPFFHRERLHKSEHEIEAMKHRLGVLHNEMRRAKDNEDLRYPSPSPMICSWCPFREPCIAMNDDGDVEFLLDEMYRERSEAA